MRKSKFICCWLLFNLLIILPFQEVKAEMTDNGTEIMTVTTNESFDAEQSITYGRVICLKNSGSNNGTLIATCDQHKWVNGEQVWPIYRSSDGGNTWTHVSDVTDNTFGTNRKAQPMLFELPATVGNMPAGTLLLAGNLVPNDQSTSRIVIYKSSDEGTTWTYVSTVDTGGPFDYDRSPNSTTTTIWEPYLYMDDYGHLICAYSDERQKANGILQALSLRYSLDGVNWSSDSNIVAIRNYNDRPGMVTVSKMGNGRYIATYEVVNAPSYNQNSSVVYCKFSDDGLNWDENDLGILVRTADGQCLGSSPFVKWVNAGGPNGMVVIAAKWVVNSSGDIQEGGQNLFVNYNYGIGEWERYPNALTWDGEDIVYLDAFSQCIDTNIDNTILFQVANIGNSMTNSSSLRIGTLPLTMALYEAENANLTNCSIITCEDSINMKEVGYINHSDSCVEFDNVYAPTNGSYTIYIRYNNAYGSIARHTITVNGDNSYTITYPITPNWHQYYWSKQIINLSAGLNTISLSYNSGYAEVDCIALHKSDADLSKEFAVKNRNSGKYLEVPSMSQTVGEEIKQYALTYYPCQLWRFNGISESISIQNVNSGLTLDIRNSSIDNGALAIQNELNDNTSQKWELSESSDGYYYIKNQNSCRLLEVVNNLTDDGAAVGQWDDTGYPCQEWKLIKEGMR